jgi:hypothetical protein
MADRFTTHWRRQREASDLLGVDVRRVPKSALAVVAFYLALAIDESAGTDGARERLWQEWDILRQQGIIAAPRPKAKA